MRRALLVGLVLVLTGCASAGTENGDIDGDWVLTEGSDGFGEFDLGKVPVTLEIDGVRAEGEGPCNSYNTTITYRGDTLNFGPVASTMMACDDLDLEGRYFAALDSVTDGSTRTDTLTLTGPGIELTYTER